MDDRKQRVLQAIVRLYGADGEPVGSTLLAKNFSMNVSSATLRNEMAALTKLGLLEQPHTSAGRVPSAKGYRYYIDNLLDTSAVLEQREKVNIYNLFCEMDFDPERLSEDAAKALANSTGYAAFTTSPKSDDVCVAHYEAVQVGLYTLSVLAVTNVGGVKTRTVKLDEPLLQGDTLKIAATLNHYLTFRNADDVDNVLLTIAVQSLLERKEALSSCVTAAYRLLCECKHPQLHLEGVQNLLRFGDMDKSFRNLMALFSNEDNARACITPKAQRTTIILGEDIPYYTMAGYCIMSKQYFAGGGRTGVIGIVGPSRMPLGDLIPRLNYFAQLLGEGMSGKKEEEMST